MAGNFKLLFNHLDAWGLTLIITALAFALHDAVAGFNLVLLAVIGMGYWLAFALNDFFDAPYDALDPEKGARNFFVVNQLEHNQTLQRGFLATAVLLCLLFVWLFLRAGWIGLILIVICLFVMWGYSAPPLRFKNRPGLDLAVHALFVETFPYVMGLLLIGAIWQPIDYAIVSLVCLASLAAQLEQQIRDVAIDAQAGGSFVTRVGVRRATICLRLVSAVLIVLAVGYALFGLFPTYVMLLGLISSPIILHRLLRGEGVARSERLVLVTLVAGLIYVAIVLVWRLI